MLSVQAGASIAKTLFAIVGPAGMVAVRIGFGTLLLAAALRPWRARMSRTSWGPLMVYGTSLGVMNLLYYLALNRIPLGVAVAIELIGPLSVAVIGSRRMIDHGWIAMAASGLFLLLPVAHLQSGIDPLGALYALSAGACWGLYIIFGQKAGADHGTRTVALGSLISAVLIVPVGAVTAGPLLLSASILLPGLSVAVLSTVIPYSLEMFALTSMPARTFGILMSLEPAFGALIGFLYLGERMSVLQWLAIGLVILASGGAAATARQSQRGPAFE